MARSINDIEQVIITEKTQHSELDGLTTTSKVSVWRFWAYITAVVINTLELLFDQHAAEMTDLIANQKKGSARWYRNMALAFQYGYGFNLIPDTDQFDNNNASDEDIEASKIVKYSAVTEAEEDSRLIVKIATEVNEELQPISSEQLTAFEAYMQEVKYAGVRVTVINYLPDVLKLQLDVYRDPLILDENGMSIKVSNAGKYPVLDAIAEYLKSLPFNGELVLAHLIDRLQLVEGVKIPNLLSAQTRWIDANVNSYGNWEEITVRKIPVSGYFSTKNPEDGNSLLTINYVV